MCLPILFCCVGNSYGFDNNADKSYNKAHIEAEKAFKELDKEIENLDNGSKKDDSNNGNNLNNSGSIQTRSQPLSDDNSIIIQEKPRPKVVENKRRPLLCDDELSSKSALPDWVLTPHVNGYPLVAVGVGMYGAGGISGQKRAARVQAQGEISKMLNVYIENELNIMQKTAARNDEVISYNSDMQSASRQRSAAKLDTVVELRCWIDPETSDYYLLVGIPASDLQ